MIAPVDRLDELQRVTDAALAYLSLDELLKELLERISATLDSDTAAILLLDEDTDELVARAAKGIEEEVEQGVRIPVGKGFAGRIAAERHPIYLPDVEHADVLNPILREKGIRSLLGVPMLIEGQITGVLHVGTLTPREFTAEDTELLRMAADRAALAIDHARLYLSERDARQRAESAARRLAALQQVSDAALAYLPLDELLDELLVRISRILSSDTAAILLLDEPSRTLVARAAKGIEEEVRQGVRIPLGKGFAGRIAAERRPIFLPDVEHADVLNPILREKRIRSMLGVPLVVEGRVTGVLHVGTLTPREFTAADTELLRMAADRAAMAIDRARLYEERRVVEALQRTLLPESLPQLPGLELAARYQPARVGTGIGGDWYDVFPLAAGHVALVIGDVMGHGVAAAALMAQMRTALRAYALEGHEPAAVADLLNRLLVPLRPTSMTTLAYAVLDTERGTARMISAGHPPPLLMTPGEAPRYLDVEGDPPLGVSPSHRYTEHTFALPADSVLVMVTDGAIEVRGEPLDAGLERLRALAAELPSPPALCDAVTARPSHEDDLAIIALRVAALPEHFRSAWPADASALRVLRHSLRRWLGQWGADEDEIYDISVAVQEASANAVEHAYAPGSAAFEVEARYADGVITVVVHDRGEWRDARGGEQRGRGLPIMETLMETVEVERSAQGTTVRLSRTLKRAGA
jgi:serine phosphatase RsbU (regulator of sigma subunit)/anti-sigma regulatory factor (Ser/Thr protein kinase)/putative methionine-R-sulfoxide reductase with GAF domain